MGWLSGTGLTRFGRHEGRDTLDLMGEATTAALAEAGLERGEVDGLLTGYSTTLPHLMLSTLFAERFGLAPAYAHGVQLGGATGFAAVMLANTLVDAGVCRNMLVVAGENRLTGHAPDAAVGVLAQVGHAEYEVPLGPLVPAYYALLASRYLHDTGATASDLAELAVLMRAHAGHHPGAQFRDPLTVADVLASRPVADPLRLLDCCPVSDGAAAAVVSREPTAAAAVRIAGTGQAHTAQHVSALPELSRCPAAGVAAARAGLGGRFATADLRYLGIYDSFTVTLAMLLEELGMAPRGEAGRAARDGRFGLRGPLPLNTHGGLLSYGHCGVGGAMAHLVEAMAQMTGRATGRQVPDASLALLHGDGGVMSSHVTLVLERVR